jgi:hypothetical protein
MRRLALIAALLVVACKPNPEGRAERNQRDVALVQKANDTLPPLEEVSPEPIGYAEMERYDLTGASCSYAPGTSFGALVIARGDDAFMKVGGKIQRFAADPGSRELPQKTRSLYNSREYSLKLGTTGEGNAVPGQSGTDYEGAVTLYDPHGRVVFEGSGLARCNG